MQFAIQVSYYSAQSRLARECMRMNNEVPECPCM